jgi:hypothetical protein
VREAEERGLEEIVPQRGRTRVPGDGALQKTATRTVSRRPEEGVQGYLVTTVGDAAESLGRQQQGPVLGRPAFSHGGRLEEAEDRIGLRGPAEDGEKRDEVVAAGEALVGQEPAHDGKTLEADLAHRDLLRDAMDVGRQCRRPDVLLELRVGGLGRPGRRASKSKDKKDKEDDTNQTRGLVARASTRVREEPHQVAPLLDRGIGCNRGARIGPPGVR